MGGVVVGVHPTTWVETTEQFASALLLDVKAHLEEVLSAHRPFQVLAARLEADFSLGAAMVTFVLGIAAAEEHAVVVQGEALGVEEGDEVAVVSVAAERPACCQIGVPCPDDIVAVSLTGQVFHQASFRS